MSAAQRALARERARLRERKERDFLLATIRADRAQHKVDIAAVRSEIYKDRVQMARMGIRQPSITAEKSVAGKGYVERRPQYPSTNTNVPAQTYATDGNLADLFLATQVTD